MIYSMTGFGKAVCELTDKIVTIEIRSLNSKQLDVNAKLHPIFREYEMEIRNMVHQELIRGKIDVMISYDLNENARAARINKGVVKDYFEQIYAVQEELNLSEKQEVMQSILRLPDVFRNEKTELKKEEWEAIKKTCGKAIMEIKSFREQEGRMLKTDIISHVHEIEQHLTQLQSFEQLRIEAVKQRIENALKELHTEDLDKNRFEQELIYYLEKLDISEEKARLKNHCEYMRETLESGDAVGKKVNFIAQEIGREVNTIGSKANQQDMQKHVVLMKDELEKIKEQALNVL